MKFTFKKDNPVGRYRSFELDHTEIKLKKKVVGHIQESRGNHTYSVSFAIKKEITKKEPAPFKWVRLKARFKTEAEARVFVKKHEEQIQERYDLYQFED